MVSMMDYWVIVIDFCEDKLKEFQLYIKNESIDCECVGGMFDDVVCQYVNDLFSIVIMLIYDFCIDDMVFMEVLIF